MRVEDVGFIAHSTTQATNALLEGDVARVGVVGVTGPLGAFARAQIRFKPVTLAPGRALAPKFEFARAGDAASLAAAVERLVAGGCETIAASAPFGVDRPAWENGATGAARARGVDATSGHDVSSTYGLRARTRTAALNAAILPRMVRTSRMTAAAVERASIPAPLMIMRSDGGVMDVHEIERRPILTMLSGPAAGVAGALLYENLTDGIFIEVGGTSSDCSAIVAGRPQMRPARIGGHRTMLRTLDVRTLGIAGGSMVRVDARGSVAGVGPRSAHIAGCIYACFADAALFDGARVETVAPARGDDADYAIVVARDGTRIAPTTSCAANLLGCVPDGAFARGDAATAKLAFELLAARTGTTAEAFARDVLDAAARTLREGIETLIADYRLDRTQVTLVGGGGGAGAIVPYTAKAMELPYRIARDAEVIAPVGVALALVRDVVERTIAAPTAEDIARLRREATDRVVAAGASPDRVEVAIEIDAQRNRVRATASGATALTDEASASTCSEQERCAIAARSLARSADALERVELTASMTMYRGGRDARALDERGVIRLALRDATVTHAKAGDASERARLAVEAATRFGDVGRALPALYVVRGARVAAFEGLGSVDQAVDLVREELEGCDPLEPVALFTQPRSA